MAIFVTRDPRFAMPDRESVIYVLVDNNGNLNEIVDGKTYLGFIGWYTDREGAIEASKHAIDGRNRNCRLTTINVEDTVIYVSDDQPA